MSLTKIEWTNDTLNPIIGCRRCSAGCDNCYAERMAARLALVPGEVGERYRQVVDKRGRWNGKQVFVPEVLEKIAPKQKPRMIFAGSMSDWFYAGGLTGVRRCLERMLYCPQHTFQLLTKRAYEMRDFQRVVCPKGFPPNLWVGMSVEDNSRFSRIRKLRRVKAAVRFVSFEPLIGPIGGPCRLDGIDWAIIGCETGPGRRPMKLSWAEELAASAREQNIPVFVKGLELDGLVVKDPSHPKWPAWAVRQWPERAQCG